MKSKKRELNPNDLGVELIKSVAHIALLVHDQDAAKDFYCSKLGFELVEDIAMPAKRWVRIRVPGGNGSDLILVKAGSEAEADLVGNQAAGRVFLFFHSSELEADVALFESRGVKVELAPTQRPHGKVAVIVDLYGNKIDLIQPNEQA